MILVFLDIDGVVHPKSANGRYFRQENITALESAFYNFDAKIIISSTWRLDKPLDEIKKYLGPTLAKRVVGTTPEINDPFLRYPRQAEVELYLSCANTGDQPWIAIDDTRAFYRDDAPVVITDGRVGFSPADIRLFRDIAAKLLS